MEDILISSPLFDKKKSKQYSLSIQLGLNGFSFCIIDELSNKLIYLNHLPQVKLKQLPELLQNHDILSLSFQKTHVMHCSGKVTSTPSALCLENDFESLFRLSFPVEDNELLLNDIQVSSGMTHLYVMDKDLHQTIFKAFPTCNIRHHQTLLTWKALNYSPTLSDEKVQLTIWDKEFHLLISKGEQVLFLNHFKYNNVEDFLYFFLYTFKQLNLHPEETSVTVQGKIFKQSILIANLKKYIRNIEFENWPKVLNYSNAFMELPGHYFTNLCLLHQCE